MVRPVSLIVLVLVVVLVLDFGAARGQNIGPIGLISPIRGSSESLVPARTVVRWPRAQIEDEDDDEDEYDVGSPSALSDLLKPNLRPIDMGSAPDKELL